MNQTESYTTKGLLVKTPKSKNWYVRFTSKATGRRIFQSTKCADYDGALRVAEELLKAESGHIDARWRQHVNTCMEDSRSWLSEMARKVRHRSGGKSRITKKQIAEIAIRSGGCCELTGLPFSLENPTGSRTPPFKPSLDRIDSRHGYSVDNCRMIAVIANLALRDWGEDVFAQMCVSFASKRLRDSLEISGEKFAIPIVHGRQKATQVTD